MNELTCKTHGCIFDAGYDCPKCLDEEIQAYSSDNPPYNEESYQKHLALEGRNAWNINPDGCFFCGGDHHSDSCHERY